MCHCDSHPVLIFEGALNVALTKKAIKALVPQNTVPEKAVLLAIARLSSTTFVRSAQVLFLKWLVLVFPMLDSTSVLRGVYGTYASHQVISHSAIVRGVRYVRITPSDES